MRFLLLASIFVLAGCAKTGGEGESGALNSAQLASSSECISIGPLPWAAFADLQDRLTGQGFLTTERNETSEIFVGHWVKVKNLENQVEADRVDSILRDAGLPGTYIIEADDGSFEISIGLFGDRDSAERVKEVAAEVGVDAAIVPRTRDATVYFVDVVLLNESNRQALNEKIGGDVAMVSAPQGCMSN